MSYLSEHDLWSMGDNILSVMPPCRNDVFVVATADGKRISLHAVDQYEQVVQKCEAYLRRWRGPKPLVVKVFCLSLIEGHNLGLARLDFLQNMTKEQEAEWHRLMVNACLETLRDCDDRRTRADAMELAKSLGVIVQ